MDLSAEDGSSEAGGFERQLSGDWGDQAAGDDWGDDDFGAKPLVDEPEPAPRVVRKKAYVPLTLKDIETKRDDFIAEHKEELNLSADETDLLLRYLRYDINKIQEFMSDLKVQQKIRLESGIGGVRKGGPPKPKKKLVCGAGCSSDPIDVSEADAMVCGHWVCKDCWAGFLNAEISSGIESVFSRCPALDAKGQKCRECVPLRMMKEHLTKENYAKLRDWVLNHFVDSMKSLKWCPGKRCTLVYDYTGGGAVDISCNKCGTQFCFACRGEAHSPCPCDLAKRWKEQVNDSDAASQRLIESLTKPCPKCGTRIEKNRQCNHMKCSKCSFDFCWQCMESITIGEKHPSWYVCKNREKAAEEGKLSKEEQARLRLNEQLGKLSYFQKRVADCQGNRELMEGFAEKVREREQKLKSGTLNWLLDIVRKASEAYRFLQWSYIFGYFMKDSPRKETFTSWQTLLETKSDQMIAELKKTLVDEKSFAEFNSDKSRVTALKQAADIVGMKTGEMQSLADIISDALMNEADSKSDDWSCIRCSTPAKSTTKEGKPILFCAKCNACRKHGDLDCLVVGCKKV
jgi:hypothetical protein